MKMRTFILIIVLLMGAVIGLAVILPDAPDKSKPKDTEEKSYIETFAEEHDISVELAESMDKALAEVTAEHMTTSQYSLKNIDKYSFKQEDDWANGRRFYGYLDGQYQIHFYCEDEEVTSIRSSNGEFVYEKG